MHIITNDFNLKHTIESGQFFRYEKIKDYYYVIVQDKFFKIRQHDNKLEFEGANKKFVRKFLGLESDFEQIKKHIAKDENIKKILAQYSGIRIMQQHPGEALIAFICSSASNIPKITMNVNLLAKKFGKKINFENQTNYLFPKIGQINNFEKIKECKVGFRAKYIFEANKIAKEILNNAEKMTYFDALQELTKIPGVGEKIADCVLLFGFNRLEAFPVDVWIKRVVEELYFENKEQNIKEIKKFGIQKFGEYAGYANQYLYHWRRNLGQTNNSAPAPGLPVLRFEHRKVFEPGHPYG